MASWNSCRYVENETPEVGRVVVIFIKEIDDAGAHVKLLEYNNIDGIIPNSALLSAGPDSAPARIGANDAAVVTKVDKARGIIELSRNRVTPLIIDKCHERLARLRTVHIILRHVAENENVPLLELYENIAWPLARIYGTALDAFRASINVEQVWDRVEFTTPAVKEELIRQIGLELMPYVTGLRADISVVFTGRNDPDVLEAALNAGRATATEATPFVVVRAAPPMFVIYSPQYVTMDVGISALNRVINTIKAHVEAVEGGCLRVIVGPRQVALLDDDGLRFLEWESEGEVSELDSVEESSREGEESLSEESRRGSEGSEESGESEGSEESERAWESGSSTDMLPTGILDL